MHTNKTLTIYNSNAFFFIPEIPLPDVPKGTPEAAKEPTKATTQQPKPSKQPPSPRMKPSSTTRKPKPVPTDRSRNSKDVSKESKETPAHPETTTKSGGSPNPDAENDVTAFMKLVVVAFIGFIVVVVVLLMVAVILFLFCFKNRKRNVEIGELTPPPTHSNIQMMHHVLQPQWKIDSSYPQSLVTDEFEKYDSSSGTHSQDLSEHEYSYAQLTDTMKREMLQDPNVTAESKEKVKKGLAEKEKLLSKSPNVSAAVNEEEGKILAEFDHLYQRK